MEHARALFEALRAPDIYRYIPGRPPFSPADLEARYRRTSAGPASTHERWWNWAVASRSAPAAPFGTVELSLSGGGTAAQLGYLFAPAVWGRGYGFEACAGALRYLRTRARTQSVTASVDTRNARSIRLLERLGFMRVETIVNADSFKGWPSDEHRYRLALDSEKDDDAQAQGR